MKLTIRRSFFLSVLVILLHVASCSRTPLSDRTRFILPESFTQENEMGTDYYQKVLGESQLSDNSQFTNMLQRVGARIAKATGKDFEWEFNVIESDQINAWALPGGKIAFYTGIFKLFENEAELAAVMGHEMAHVTLRHGGERMSQQLIQQIGGAFIVGLAPDQQSQELFLGAYAGITTVGVMLPFSRAHEFEADNVGTRYMATAGYDPQAAVDFWKKMNKLMGGKKPPEFLSTHPSDEKRIEKLQDFMPKAKRMYGSAGQQFGKGEIL